MNTKTLKQLVSEGVAIYAQMELKKESLDSVCETASLKLDTSKAEFRKLVVAQYQLELDEQKFVEKREKVEELYNNLDAINE